MKTMQSIAIGDTVLVALNGRVEELQIVDVPQANPKLGKISWLSPLAKALLGRDNYPDRVTVKLENGKTLECELLRIAH